MEKSKLNLRFRVITLMVFVVAMCRLLPSPPNFAPIGAMALFGAAYFTKRYWAFLIPVASMWISDLILNNTIYGQYFDHFVWFSSFSLFTYGAFTLIVVLGMFTLKKVRVSNLLFSALGTSVIFFLVSNFGVWLMFNMYPKTLSGLMACYVAGIPFFHNTVMGDLVYTSAMFVIFELYARKFPQLAYCPATMANSIID
ncbi:MAG: hypothetical protein LBI15_03725 [Dysgonamonadaceae bacterium]|jgi:hypothetical protein|nr:hypothetical protein [Dysgonamonadaceae bacterium]